MANKKITDLMSGTPVRDSLLESVVDINGTLESRKVKAGAVADLASANVAAPYDSTVTYAIGQYCLYEGDIYRCIAITTGAFDSTAWVQIVVTGEFRRVVELTSAQYSALSSAEQNNGTLYIITDEETTAADIPYSSGVSVEDKLDSLNDMFKSGTASIASPRISINNQSGTYYRVGNIITAKITIVFNSDGQNLGAYFNTFALDGVSTNTTKLMGFMGVDNDLYELETLNNDSIWVYKNGTRINAVNLNGKTAYLTIHATL